MAPLMIRRSLNLRREKNDKNNNGNGGSSSAGNSNKTAAPSPSPSPAVAPGSESLKTKKGGRGGGGRGVGMGGGFSSVLAMSAASVSASAIPPPPLPRSPPSPTTTTKPTTAGADAVAPGNMERKATMSSPTPPMLTSRKSAEAVTAVTTVEYAAGESVNRSGESRSGLSVKHDVSPSASVRTLPATATGRGDGARGLKKDSTITKRSSWFSRKGTWPRAAGVSTTKSPPVTDVAREYASGENLPTTGGANTAVVGENANESTAENGNGNGLGVSSLPEPAKQQGTVTIPEPTPEQQKVAETITQTPQPTAKETIVNGTDEATAGTTTTETTAPPTEGSTELKAGTDATPEPGPNPKPRTSWVDWWYGRTAETEPVSEGDADKEAELHVSEAMTSTTTSTSQPADDTEPSTTSQQQSEQPEEPQKMDDDSSSKPPAKDPEDVKREEAKQVAIRKSWFGFWGGGVQEGTEEGTQAQQPPVPEETQQEHVPEQVAEAAAEEAAATATTTPAAAAAPEAQEPVDQTATAQPAKGGYGLGWFWSQKEEPAGALAETKPTVQEGEVAVVNDTAKSTPPPQKALIKLPEVVVKPLRGSTSTQSLQEDAAAGTPKPKAPATQKSQPVAPSPLKAELNASTVSLPTNVVPDDSAARKNLHKVLPTNHLLPAFESCYTHPDQPSLIQQLTNLTRITSFFRPPPPPESSHLYLTRTPPKIHKAVAIGVHGFFPMRLVRTVLGEPTGTSKRFANHAANSIRRWAETNNIPVEVETIALEGEGKVADRVVVLWKLLQNWISAVQAADFILIAAHSQGVPVGMQLLAKMIEEGVVNNAQRIGFLGMAGINLGPFGHLPTAMLTGSAKELFEFQKQSSSASQNYYAALEKVIAYNRTRICFVGSIDDQLVPLESSTMTNISHPYIYRAVFVDGRLHTPDFLSHLVGFAMKLRNLGVSDHGLIRELSSPLAGSLYGGEGHSRIYDDGCVYDLGIRHALETTTISPAPPPLKIDPFELPTNSNPFFLPWSMRGLLEETFVRTRLQKESWELLEQFENWKPTTKQLKDVKFRLEAVRSKL